MSHALALRRGPGRAAAWLGSLSRALARRATAHRPCYSSRMIEACQRALVLAPHTDDGEFGCGGTTARLVEAGCEVRYVAFSIATRSLPRGLPAGHARARGARGDGRARDPRVAPDGARLRRAHVPRAAPGHPRAARRAVGGVEARHRLPAVPPRRAPGSPDDRPGGPAGVQADDDPRLRDPVEQLRLLLRRLRRASSSATSSARSRRSRSTPRSSIAATRTPSTSGTSRRCTART